MAGQVGWAAESTVGTAVTPTVFLPLDSLSANIDEGWMEDNSVVAGRFTQKPSRLGARVVGFTLDQKLYNLNVATLLKHLWGADTITLSGPYNHALAVSTSLGKAMTVQFGVEDAGGTVRPFTCAGSKAHQFSLGASVGDFAKLNTQWTSKDVVTATALASASYAAGLVPFTFVESTVSVAGTQVASARSMEVQVAKGLKTDRHTLGSRLIREQLNQDKWKITSSVTADFDDLTIFALQVAGTQVACVHTFNNGTDSLIITTSGQVTSAVPGISTNGLEEYTINLNHSHATSDASAFGAVLVNGEATS